MREYKILKNLNFDAGNEDEGSGNGNMKPEFSVRFDLEKKHISAVQTAPMSVDDYIALAVTFLYIIRQLIGQEGDSTDMIRLLAAICNLVNSEEFRKAGEKDEAADTSLKS